MNKFQKIILWFFIVVTPLCGLVYYTVSQIDFIGNKDPKSVEVNVQRWRSMLFSAEYRNGTDYFRMDIPDSTSVELVVGDSRGAYFLTEGYKVIGDTIVVQRDTANVGDRLSTNKLLLRNNKVYFKVDSSGVYDTTKLLMVKLNKLSR